MISNLQFNALVSRLSELNAELTKLTARVIVAEEKAVEARSAASSYAKSIVALNDRCDALDKKAGNPVALSREERSTKRSAE